MGKSNNIAYCRESVWYHKVRTLNLDGTFNTEEKGGFATETEAEASYLEAKKDFDNAYREYLMTHELNKEIMLKDYLRFWFDGTFSQRIESSTRMTRSYVLDSWLMPNISQDIKLRYVTAEYLNALLEKVAIVSPSAGNATRELLYMAFKDAMLEGYINNNPVVETKQYKRKKPEVKILSREQMRVLLSSATKSNWYLEILLGLFCGLRKGEIMGLKFSDFDTENSTVKISRQLGKEYYVDPVTNEKKTVICEKAPKTDNSYRMLKVPEVIIKELKKRELVVKLNKEVIGNEYEDNDYVSCQKDGQPHNSASFNGYLHKLCKRNGLPAISVHSLRHMYATILMEQGVELHKISALLGHSSVNITFEYYCDVIDEKERIVDFLNSSFEYRGGAYGKERYEVCGL